MSKKKEAFEAGMKAYNDPKFVYKPEPYNGPMVTNWLDENGNEVGVVIEQNVTILNDDWDKNLKVKK